MDPAELGRILDGVSRMDLLWGAEWRTEFERRGMVIVPAGFYYPVPTAAEVADSFEARERLPYDDASVFDPAVLSEHLLWLLPFSEEFDPPAHSDDEATYAWDNRMFGYSDAMAYYATIRATQPDVVLEVGSGASTLIALEALHRNGRGRVVCVEPFPRDFLRSLDVELVESAVQDLPAEWFAERLPEGAVFFIDSTHTVRVGSDCLHLYLRVLPALRERVWVHVHDFNLPRGSPQDWIDDRLFWTEQYLAFAYLLHNRRARAVFGSVVNTILHPDLMRDLMHDRAAVGGGSLWFEQAGQ
jgi:hypothetical protein